MQTHFTSLDGFVLAGSFLATMAVGFYLWKRSRSVESLTAAEVTCPAG